ncbi:MAG: ATP-binding protein [Leptolyngbyaceae cyanobacterium SM1_3_5]|nr:ATP-binding protein [Leptolyngbyaceae cyanobacterium SM1_3_5]
MARQWIDRFPQTVWVSTDAIREQRFGNEATQGDWAAIEAQAIEQIKAAIAGGKSVIYDATNVRRAWRLEFCKSSRPARSTGWRGSSPRRWKPAKPAIWYAIEKCQTA